MSTKEDYINIGLMIFACGLAFVIPFELFLFSYAVLGPLHYLTEIAWLHQRDYFSTGKKDYLILVVLCLLISIGVVYQDIFVMRKYFNSIVDPEISTSIMKVFLFCFPVFILSAFLGSIGLVFFKKTAPKLILFSLGILLGILLGDSRFNLVLMGTFVPTLIHVYVFTGLFMLYGALKSGSKIGYVSVLIFVGCALSFYFIQFVPKGFEVSNYLKDALTRSGFVSVNAAAIGLFKSDGITFFDIFASRRGLMVQRFIAFAYTYHYLNWFSKTEIIKWHLVPKKWLFTSLFIWLASISLYLYDYRTGLIALFFLSMLHVFLEFPLNFRSILGIKEELKNKFYPKKTTSISSQKGT